MLPSKAAGKPRADKRSHYREVNSFLVDFGVPFIFNSLVKGIDPEFPFTGK